MLVKIHGGSVWVWALSEGDATTPATHSTLRLRLFLSLYLTLFNQGARGLIPQKMATLRQPGGRKQEEQQTE
ncbi:hypothetical protein E2C01_099314 [Portunus trituberculatus]|uniref:Uncharacterized protein n=1 Tax=Portunus trituberculatus TaxID=210409 RepID=A0A5B7KAN4_PORTR|nr:hypothetical protein [Portunus trituberculatus]